MPVSSERGGGVEARRNSDMDPTYPAWRADALPAPSCDHGAQSAALVGGGKRG